MSRMENSPIRRTYPQPKENWRPTEETEGKLERGPSVGKQKHIYETPHTVTLQLE